VEAGKKVGASLPEDEAHTSSENSCFFYLDNDEIQGKKEIVSVVRNLYSSRHVIKLKN